MYIFIFFIYIYICMYVYAYSCINILIYPSFVSGRRDCSGHVACSRLRSQRTHRWITRRLRRPALEYVSPAARGTHICFYLFIHLYLLIYMYFFIFMCVCADHATTSPAGSGIRTDHRARYINLYIFFFFFFFIY